MRDIARSARISLRRLKRIHATKDALILEYLGGRHSLDVLTLETLRGADYSPQRTLMGILDSVEASLRSPEFRGCAFLNASAEAGHLHSSIRAAVHAHRDWYVIEATRLLREAGHPCAADASDDLMLARDGAMVSVHGGTVAAAMSALRRAVERAIRECNPA